MEKKPFIAQTSMVPVLACVAALLFSANFYQFLQKNFKKWWGWDFTCPVEQVDCHRHEVDQEHRRHHKHRKQRRHRQDRRHRHEVQDRHTIIFEYDGDHDRMEDAERKLHRNLERAMRERDRLHERMEWDAATDANRERLETEIRIKAMNLRAMERIKRRLESHGVSRDHQTEDDIIHEFHGDDNVEIRIRKHH